MKYVLHSILSLQFDHPYLFKNIEREILTALIYSNHSICRLLSCYDHLYCCQLCSFVSLFSYLCFANKTFPSQLCFYQHGSGGNLTWAYQHQFIPEGILTWGSIGERYVTRRPPNDVMTCGQTDSS